MEDPNIVELFQARDETAISETKNKYGRLLHSIAYNILANHEDCEECVSDTYLKAWNTIPPENPKHLSAYLGRIVRNLAINLWHKNRAQKRFNPADQILDELAEILPAAGNPETDFDALELSCLISDWLRHLPAEDRILFVQRYWYGESLKTMARLRGTTANKLAGRIFRLRQKLRTKLESEGIFYE